MYAVDGNYQLEIGRARHKLQGCVSQDAVVYSAVEAFEEHVGQHRAHATDTYSMLSWGYEPTGKDLKCQYSYRFQVEGYNNHEAQFGESWSRIHALDPKNTAFNF